LALLEENRGRVSDVGTFLDEAKVVFLVIGPNTVEGRRFEHANITGKWRVISHQLRHMTQKKWNERRIRTQSPLKMELKKIK
jgi:hypothetical protein